MESVTGSKGNATLLDCSGTKQSRAKKKVKTCSKTPGKPIRKENIHVSCTSAVPRGNTRGCSASIQIQSKPAPEALHDVWWLRRGPHHFAGVHIYICVCMYLFIYLKLIDFVSHSVCTTSMDLPPSTVKTGTAHQRQTLSYDRDRLSSWQIITSLGGSDWRYGYFMAWLKIGEGLIVLRSSDRTSSSVRVDASDD